MLTNNAQVGINICLSYAHLAELLVINLKYYIVTNTSLMMSLSVGYLLILAQEMRMVNLLSVSVLLQLKWFPI